MIRDDLALAVRRALADADLPEPPGGVKIDPPKQRDHGDWATPAALALAKPVGRPPLEIAERLAAALDAAGVAHLERTEVAPPGFVNLYLRPTWLHDVLRTVVAAGDRFGTSDALAGERINLEFVSANPTGPLHAGGGRWVAVGDAIANLLAAQGAAVHREYYVNDTGNQLATFRDSLYARYRGESPPEDGYQGEYLVDLARDLHAELGDDVSPDDACEWGVQRVIEGLRYDLGRIGVHFDTWFSERTLHERGEVADVLRVLEERGVVYDKDNARWLRSTDFGDTRDRVLVRSDGTTTYLCTRSLGALTISSTCGAPTTTARSSRCSAVWRRWDSARHPSRRCCWASSSGSCATASRSASPSVRATSSRWPTSSTRSTPTSRA
jgi:arginyl-tRNA synthetase